MNHDEVIIRAEGVSKSFCRNLKRSLLYGVQDIASDLVGRDRSRGDLRKGEFWANSDVSFELRRGECLGLIGRNGAGKTTLLKMLNGLIKPDRGRIETRGRVGALIALGAGFNPILTGRENVNIAGSVLGLSRRQIKDKYDDIVDFSGLEDFMDTPVQSYSSGMQVRLGFAVATALEPDVLLLDEVLAVGDASFRHKCYHRINKLIGNCAVVFVSHSMEQVAAISTSIGMMRKGKLEVYNNVTDGIQAYHDCTDSLDTKQIDGGRVFAVYHPVTHADLRIENPHVDYGGALKVEIEVVLSEPLENLKLNFTALNQSEKPVMTWSSVRAGKPLALPAGRSVIRLRIDPLYLHDGMYRWCFGLIPIGSIEHVVYAMRGGSFAVRSNHPPLEGIPYLPQAAEFRIQSS